MKTKETIIVQSLSHHSVGLEQRAGPSCLHRGAKGHLAGLHRMVEFGAPSTPSDLFSVARGALSSLPPSTNGRQVAFNDIQFKDKLIDWTIDLDLSFRQVVHQRTRRLFSLYIDDIGHIDPHSASTISDWTRTAWLDDRKPFLKAKLHLPMSKIHLSVDIWTSSEGTNYVAVVAHWLDEKKKLRQALLDLPLLKGPHSGENVASVISTVVDYYDISTLLGYFLMDNATNNRTIVAELAKRYPTVKASSQLRCCGHILNLIVKALLFGKGVSKLERKLCGASDEDKFDT